MLAEISLKKWEISALLYHNVTLIIGAAIG